MRPRVFFCAISCSLRAWWSVDTAVWYISVPPCVSGWHYSTIWMRLRSFRMYVGPRPPCALFSISLVSRTCRALPCCWCATGVFLLRVSRARVLSRPYGELGSVERANVCCFVGFTSNLSSVSEGGGQSPMIPGNCCETALVDEIVRELKMRWVGGWVAGCGGRGRVRF